MLPSGNSLSLIYFSPTGNSRQVARHIGRGTGLPMTELDRTLLPARQHHHRFSSEEIVLLALPVYGGRLPVVAGDFFDGLRGDRTPAILAVTYGNRHYDDALRELQALAESHGFFPIAAGAFVGQHTFNAQVGAGRPSAADAQGQEDFGRLIRAKLDSAAGNFPPLTVPGEFPSARPLAQLHIAPSVADDCDGCGTCVDECPAGAIFSADPHQTDAALCLACGRCVQLCPRQARALDHEKIHAAAQRLATHFLSPRPEEIFL